MEHSEIEKELKMTYEELQEYLLKKYGAATCDYFATPECRSRSKKISRTKEGLYCHHMDEDKGSCLSEVSSAKRQPFEWQKKERLVYCNILEHLILHIKIAVLRQKKKLTEPKDISRFFTTHGINSLCKEINDMYLHEEGSSSNIVRCFEEIKENYNDYILLLGALMKYIEVDYCGNKTDSPFFISGREIEMFHEKGIIYKISKDGRKFLFKSNSNAIPIKVVPTEYIESSFLYCDMYMQVIRELSYDFESFCVNIYKDIVKYINTDSATKWSKILKVDYRGYGFPQYGDIELGVKFGSYNADEYIAKALPMYSNNIVDLSEKTPYFWKGSEIPPICENSFFIVRVKAVFYLKEGMEACVQYREKDRFRNDNYSVENGYLNRREIKCTILETSDIYNQTTKEYMPFFINTNGVCQRATVILTLGKNDFSLFKERYDIHYLEVLDGCYFS